MAMKVIIFGASDLASLAWYVLSHDSPHQVVGFTVDAAYRASDSKHGLPVVPFEDLERFFVPGEAAMIAPLGYRLMHGLAAEKLLAARAHGYTLISYVSAKQS
jgi:hypothetical protein